MSHNGFDFILFISKNVQWKPDITGMVGPEQNACYSRSLLYPKIKGRQEQINKLPIFSPGLRPLVKKILNRG